MKSWVAKKYKIFDILIIEILHIRKNNDFRCLSLIENIIGPFEIQLWMKICFEVKDNGYTLHSI